MTEQVQPKSEIITSIPDHLKDEPETPHYNETFYVEETSREGGAAVMSPGWKEVYTTETPDQEGRYWTTLKNPRSGTIAKVPTAELYALQDRVGNPVAPREPLPFTPEQPATAEVISERAVDFAKDAGQVAVPEVVAVAPSILANEVHTGVNSPMSGLDFLSGKLGEAASPRGRGLIIHGSVEGMLKRGEISGDNPSVLQLLAIAGALEKTRGMYADPRLTEEARLLVEELKHHSK